MADDWSEYCLFSSARERRLRWWLPPNSLWVYAPTATRPARQSAVTRLHWLLASARHSVPPIGRREVGRLYWGEKCGVSPAWSWTPPSDHQIMGAWIAPGEVARFKVEEVARRVLRSFLWRVAFWRSVLARTAAMTFGVLRGALCSRPASLSSLCAVPNSTYPPCSRTRPRHPAVHPATGASAERRPFRRDRATLPSQHVGCSINRWSS